MEVRPTTTIEEFAAAVGTIGHYFGGWPDREGAERFARNLPLERMHAAFDGDRVVGGAGALPFELTVPGGQVRCGGVTVVGVQPTDRRRGVLTKMMRVQLETSASAASRSRRSGHPRRRSTGASATGSPRSAARWP